MKTEIKMMFRSLMTAYPPLAMGQTLVMQYPYTAAISEDGINVSFRDFPDSDLPLGSLTNVTAEMHALHCLGIIHSRLYHEHRMIPLPTQAQYGEHYAVVPESAALTILRRNWELAQVMRQARAQAEIANQRSQRRVFAEGTHVNLSH